MKVKAAEMKPSENAQGKNDKSADISVYQTRQIIS